MGRRRRVYMPNYIEDRSREGKPYGVRIPIPPRLQEAVARITGKPVRVKLRESLDTHDLAEAHRKSHLVIARLLDILEQADAYTDPVAIAGAFDRNALKDMTFARLNSLTDDQCDRATALIVAQCEREQAHIAAINDLCALLRCALPPMTSDKLAQRCDAILTTLDDPPPPTAPHLGGEPSADVGRAVDYQYVIDEIWAADRDRPPGPKAIDNKRSKMARLFAWLIAERGYPAGCTDMARVSAADLQAYKKSLPVNLRRHHLIDVKALFRSAFLNAKLPAGNPAADLNVPAKWVDPRRKRIKFSDSERALILRKARESDDPVIRYTTLVSAFTGAHTSEIVEAHTDDIEVRPDGVVLLHIRETNRADEERLKDEARERTLPLHSAIRDEIVAYRDRVVAKHGGGPLFPTVGKDKYGRRNTLASNAIMKWFRAPEGCGIDDPRKDTYCWRKTVRSLLMDRGVDPDRARYIVGHAARDIDARHYQDHELPQLIAAIEKIDDPTAP